MTADGRGFLLGRLKWSKVRWLHNPVNMLRKHSYVLYLKIIWYVNYISKKHKTPSLK